MYECAHALSFIHSKGYLHNDLKGDNMIISEVDKMLHPIIIDFGKSTTKPKAKSTSYQKEIKRSTGSITST